MKPQFHWLDEPDRPIVSLDGIWCPVEDGAVFACLTTETNSLVVPIHFKAVPVLLHDEDERR